MIALGGWMPPDGLSIGTKKRTSFINTPVMVSSRLDQSQMGHPTSKQLDI